MNDGRKDDAEKARVDLLPVRALELVSRVLGFGARKYGVDNWRLVPDARRRYYAAALRHMFAWWRGELVDPDTGESHLAHAAASLLFILELEQESK